MARYGAVWLRKLLRELFDQVLDMTVIYCHKKNGRLEKNLVGSWDKDIFLD